MHDAVLAVIGGALRRCLADKQGLPEQSLVALAPVNTRQESKERLTTGNSISFLAFPLATDVADPIARLTWIQTQTSQTKALSKAIGGRDLTEISKFAPPATLALTGRLATMVGIGGQGPLVLHNCIVTNVPGANANLTMLGAKLRYWSGLGPITDGTDAIFTVSSLTGRTIISLTSCPEMVPDPEFMGNSIRASIDELGRAAAGAQALTRGSKRLGVKGQTGTPRSCSRPDSGGRRVRTV